MLPLIRYERVNRSGPRIRGGPGGRTDMMDKPFPIEQVFPRLILFMLYVTTVHDMSSQEIILAITGVYLLLLVFIYHVPGIEKRDNMRQLRYGVAAFLLFVGPFCFLWVKQGYYSQLNRF